METDTRDIEFGRFGSKANLFVKCCCRRACIAPQIIGFTTESPEFDIPGIGFHYEMKLNLNQK